MRNLQCRKVNQPDQADKCDIKPRVQPWVILSQRLELCQLHPITTISTTTSNITTAVTTTTTVITSVISATITTTITMATTTPFVASTCVSEEVCFQSQLEWC